LRDEERIIVPTLDSSVRDLGALLGIGKTQAAHIRQRLIDRLRNELSEDEDPNGTLKALCELCDLWLKERIGSAGSTSRDTKRNERGDDL
jgi:hypothetical protein